MSSVSFKGTREGLCITLGEGGWNDLLNELALQLERPSAQAFFRGARVLLETGTRAIGVTEIEELVALLAQHDMTLGSIVGAPGAQQALDLVQTTLTAPEAMEPGNGDLPTGESVPPEEELPALFVHRTVRSGQVIQHAGTVVVYGDVNPGAEVIAEGDVLVWGKLRGVVHAGASGNENAIVGALILAPTQLRIGGQIARAPDGKRPGHAPAEIARVRNGQIVVEPWTG